MELQELKSLFLFETFNPGQLDWLQANSTELKVDAGSRLFTEGTAADGLYVLLEGELRLSRMIEGMETIVTTTDYRGAWIGGIPVIGGFYPSTSLMLTAGRMLKIPVDGVRYMLEKGFPIAMHLLAGIAVGARNIEAVTRQQEKMAALGKFSAGLAHELNNPAAAGRRAASQLRQALDVILDGSLGLGEPGGMAQAELIQAKLKEALGMTLAAGSLNTLEQSEREDELNDWLEAHGVEEGWRLAPTFVNAGLTTGWLEEFSKGFTANSQPGRIFNWLEAALTARELVTQVEQSTEKISRLVKAVKEYSYMDQGPQQEVNIEQGLESTLTMLAHKLKNISVVKDYAPDLPRIFASGSELNQVWTNLIDNAVDAMEPLKGAGKLTLRTRLDNKLVVVEIGDNGPGIPEKLQSRIFEPFFTTKDVGKGTGMGLDIVYRIITRQHKGDIKVASQPGDTRFIVRLPLRDGVISEK